MSSDKIGEIIGRVTWELFGPDGGLIATGQSRNALTQVGEQNLAERGTGFAAPAAPTGMRLGAGSTAVAKTGAGAALVTKLTDGNQAFDGTYPQSALSGSGNNARRITFKTTYAAGKATTASPNHGGRDRQRHDRLRHRDGGGGHVRPRPARRHRVEGCG